MSDKRLVFLIPLVLILSSCSSGKTKAPSQTLLNEKYLFQGFNKNENYHFKAIFNYPSFKGYPKTDAQKARKGILIHSLKELMGMVYMLPQNYQWAEKENDGLNRCEPNYELKIKGYGLICEKVSYNQKIDVYKVLHKYKEVNKSSPAYNIYFHDTDSRRDSSNDRKFDIRNGKISPYYLDNKSRLPLIKRTYQKVPQSYSKSPHRVALYLRDLGNFTNIDDQTYSPPLFEKNYLTHKYRRNHYTRVSIFNQFIARTSTDTNAEPIVSGSKELNKFVQEYTFSKISKQKFKEKVIIPIIEKAKRFHLNGDNQGINTYLNYLTKKTALFFRELDYIDGFNQVDKKDFTRFLTDKKMRERLFGLIFLAYSDFKPKRTDSNSIGVEVEIDIKGIFEDFKFEKITDHIEE